MNRLSALSPTLVLMIVEEVDEMIVRVGRTEGVRLITRG